MTHLQPALYDPELVFFEENDHHRKKLAMDFKMYEIAKEAGDQFWRLRKFHRAIEGSVHHVRWRLWI